MQKKCFIFFLLLPLYVYSQVSPELDMFKGDNGKCGFRTLNKRVILAPKYDDEFEFRDGLAAVKLGNKWGYIDKT